MLSPSHILACCRRAVLLVHLLRKAERRETERVELWYPPTEWFRESAPEMLRILDRMAVRLERRLGLSLPPDTSCHVTFPEVAVGIQGAIGAAYRSMSIIGVPERHLSEFALVAGHELAHLASRQLAEYGPPFLTEGFACWAAARIGADRRPMGLPLHAHLKWMVWRRIPPSLEELWARRDYSPELYDLGWSFASFVIWRFSRQRYYRLYSAPDRELEARVEAVLEVPLRKLEQEWHEHGWSRVDVDPAAISRMHRYDGMVCSRAAWLRKRA